jgi:hypothetical protein
MKDALNCISARNQRYVHAVLEDRLRSDCFTNSWLTLVSSRQVSKGAVVLVLAVLFECDLVSEDQP